MASHYNVHRVRNGLVHFLTGKAFTAVSTVLVLFLLARALPKEDYAALIVFESLLALTGMATSFGINQTLLRYVPELRAAGNALALYRLIRNAMLSRALIIGLALAGLAVASSKLGAWLGFEHQQESFRWFLLAGWASLMWYLLGQVMESLMWQKSSQYIIAVTAMLRLGLLGMSYLRGEADLMRVVMIEIACESLTLGWLIMGFLHNQHCDPHRREGNLAWFDENQVRISRYARSGYIFTASTLLYGSQPNRAVVARFLPPTAMGDYGFADSLTALFRRFLPSALLIGFIRPLYFARYAESGQLHHLERTANLIFRVNLVFLGSVVLALLFFGSPVLDILTTGKYGSTIYLVAAMLCVLALDSLQMQHALLCQTLERNDLLIIGNVILSGSLLVSIPLFSVIGVWAIVFANLIGNLLSISFIRIQLTRVGQAICLDVSLITRVIVYFASASTLGYWVQHAGHPMLGGGVALTVWVMLSIFFRPFSNDEIYKFRVLFNRMSVR